LVIGFFKLRIATPVYPTKIEKSGNNMARKTPPAAWRGWFGYK
jgi:hypothetical protein